MIFELINRSFIIKKHYENHQFFVVALIIAGTAQVFGYPGGVSGYTKKSGTAGCGCHGSSYFNTSVLVKITGPDTVVAGKTATYTVRVSGGSNTKAGVDIAVSNGTLTAVSTYLKKLNSELTQSSGVTYVSGGVDFKFTYTAPTTAGAQTIYATGSSKKQWNWMDNKAIVVVSPAAVEDVKTEKQFVLNGCYPNPFNNRTKVSVTLASESRVSMQLYTVTGAMVQTMDKGYMVSGEHSIPVQLDAQAAGVYFLRVIAEDKSTGVLMMNKSVKLVYLR